VGLARQELDHRAHQDHTVLHAANRAPPLHVQVVERLAQAFLLSKRNKETQWTSRLYTFRWLVHIDINTSKSHVGRGIGRGPED